jgi:hypothetical protein
MSDERDKPKMIRADQALRFVYLKYGANVVHPFITALLIILSKALWDGLVEGEDARIGMFWVFVVIVIVAIIGLRHAIWHLDRFGRFNTAEREMAKEEGRYSEELDDKSFIVWLIWFNAIFMFTLGPAIYRWVFYYETFWGKTVIDGKVF